MGIGTSLGTLVVVSICLGGCAPEASRSNASGAAGSTAGSAAPTAGNPNIIVPMVVAGRPAAAQAGTAAPTTPSTPRPTVPPVTTAPTPGQAGRPALPPPVTMPGAAGAAPTAPAAGSGGTLTPPNAMGDRATPEGVCGRWKADRANLSEGMWTGNVTGCMAGDMAPEARETTLRVINLYRWLADLPAVTHDPTMDKQAQACALLMRANNMLSHTPPTTWTCYNEEGAKAAGRCNISSGPSVSSVDGYMVDPGNPTTIGHRRWILSNTFGPTGLGGTDRHSCMMTMGNMKVGKPWMAWPAPGIIPLQAMSQGRGQWSQSIDQTGWTVQSDSINLANAVVTVTSDGMMLPVTVTQLGAGYGSRYAFRFNPMGWTTTAGKTYTISVTGSAKPIMYDVTFVDCK